MDDCGAAAQPQPSSSVPATLAGVPVLPSGCPKPPHASQVLGVQGSEQQETCSLSHTTQSHSPLQTESTKMLLKYNQVCSAAFCDQCG